MAAYTYHVCTCGHKDVLHAVDKPHRCRSRDCECPAFVQDEKEEGK